MKKWIIFLVMVAAWHISAATNDFHDTDSTYSSVRSYVSQDEKIRLLLDVHNELSKNRNGIPGFRVQIYMDSGTQARLRTQRARAEFESKYPDVNAYITYDEPNFKLRVGDFRTRLDARRFIEHISDDYPRESVYIVVDTINFPDLDQ
jgi:hypothetical protein